MCASVVIGLVFSYRAKRLAWGTSPKWPFCVEWDGKPQLDQSVEGRGQALVVVRALCFYQCVDAVGWMVGNLAGKNTWATYPYQQLMKENWRSLSKLGLPERRPLIGVGVLCICPKTLFGLFLHQIWYRIRLLDTINGDVFLRSVRGFWEGMCQISPSFVDLATHSAVTLPCWLS